MSFVNKMKYLKILHFQGICLKPIKLLLKEDVLIRFVLFLKIYLRHSVWWHLEFTKTRRTLYSKANPLGFNQRLYTTNQIHILSIGLSTTYQM